MIAPTEPVGSHDDSWERYLPTADDVADVVYETDLQGVIRWISPSVHDLLEWQPEQLVNTPARDLVHPLDLDRVDAMRALVYTEKDRYQQIPCMFRMASGAYRAATVRSQPRVDAAGTVIGATVRLSDTHDRDAALRALATLSQANRTLIRATDKDSLLQQMCETIVGTGRYLFSWYGRPADDPDQSVVPIAQAGRSDGYLDEVRISWGDNPLGRGPAGMCIRLQQTRVSNDPDVDPDYTPWAEPAARRGFRSSICLPVFVDERLDGALVAYAAEPHAFDAMARDLLEDLAADLGYGIGRLRAVADRAAATALLAESEQRYRLLAENTSDVVILSTPSMDITWVSPAITPAFGHQPGAFRGSNAAVFIHPDDVGAVVAEVERTDADKSILHVRHRMLCADGTYRWVDVVGGHIDDDGTGRPGRVVAMRDIDTQVRAEQELAARETQYRLLAENASDVVWQTSRDGRIAWVSPSITPMLGWRPGEVLGTSGLLLLHPDDHATILADARAARATQNEFRIRAKDGTWRWMSVSIRTVEVPGGLARIVSMRDIDDEVVARQQLEHALGHDQLTGLPTRGVMTERISATQEQLPRFHVMGVMCVGVDGLSEVNEALTHTAGDLLLTTVAARIVEAASNPDHVGRGSGNELVVLIPDLRSGADAGTVAETLRRAGQGDTTIVGQPLAPTISIGIAIGGSDADPGQLLRDASLALRKAKDNGRDRYEFADPGLAIEAKHRLVLDNDIRLGVAAGAFVPWFQPIVDLASGRPMGYESLVRWMRPSGKVQPVSFLNVAERSALITDIDIAVMTQSIAALSQLPDSMYIAVNVSAASLGRPAYADRAIRALKMAAIDPSRLHIEVTESMLLDPTEPVVEAIKRLAHLGVRWYIDDFGTGYASITSLRDLPMSGLKLDRSFTYGITSNDKTSMQLAQALVGLADGLGLDTVAEGVETQAQADFLRDLGWRHGQGWLFGKPTPLPFVS
jgi:diguanylate cyclase (GGDEF)-like protein/PAS domain S-box-containing protein